MVVKRITKFYGVWNSSCCHTERVTDSDKEGYTENQDGRGRCGTDVGVVKGLRKLDRVVIPPEGEEIPSIDGNEMARKGNVEIYAFGRHGAPDGRGTSHTSTLTNDKNVDKGLPKKCDHYNAKNNLHNDFRGSGSKQSWKNTRGCDVNYGANERKHDPTNAGLDFT